MGVLKVWDGTGWQSISATSDGAASVYVGQEAPPGTPDAGDLWWDTDETAPGVNVPMSVVNGGTGATSPAAARTSLAVPSMGSSAITAGAPTGGTWARGDQWLDSANVLWTCVTAGTPGTWKPPPGTELYYNQITATVTLTNGSGAQHIVIDGTSLTYDGGPIIVEFYSSLVQAPSGGGLAACVSLLDVNADLGILGEIYNASTAVGATVHARRRIVPTPGLHTYRIGGWVNGGTGYVYGSPGGAATQSPAYLRISRG